MGNNLNNIDQLSVDRRKPSRAQLNETLNSSSLSIINAAQCVASKNSLDDFNIEYVIGYGAFSTVYLVKDKVCNQEFALKSILKSSIIEKNSINSLRNENKILTMISHALVTKYHNTFQDEDNIYFLMDYIKGEELYYLLKEHKQFSEKQAKFYLAEVYSIISYLHSQNIIYRDLKTENIIVDQEGHIKLIDFGVSKVVSQRKMYRTSSFKGTFEYIPPEAISQNASYSFEFDLWSFGVLMYKMLTGVFPFESRDPADLLYMIKYKDIDIMNDINLVNLSYDTKALLKKLLTKNAEERINDKDIITHSWFNNLTLNSIDSKKMIPPFKPMILRRDYNERIIRRDSHTKRTEINQEIFKGF